MAVDSSSPPTPTVCTKMLNYGPVPVRHHPGVWSAYLAAGSYGPVGPAPGPPTHLDQDWPQGSSKARNASNCPFTLWGPGQTGFAHMQVVCCVTTENSSSLSELQYST